MARSLVLPLVLASAPFALAASCAFVGCVGDDPVVTATDASTVPTTTPTGTSTTPTSDAALPDTSTPVDSSADTATPDAGGLHYVFVTSGSTTGAFAVGLPAPQNPWTFADERCSREAIAASLPGRYVAWLSFTDGVGTKFNASGRIADWPYYLPGGLDGSAPVLIAQNRVELITKGAAAPVDRLASGVQVDFDENSAVAWVWTGSNGDGTAATQDCNGWTSGLATQSGIAGNARRIPSFTPTDWTAFGGRTCDVRRRFYCFQVP